MTSQAPASDPHAFFYSTMQRLIGNAQRDFELAQANADALSATKARIRLDTLTAAVEIHRASLKVAARTAVQLSK